MSSDISIEGIIDDNLRGAVSGTEDDIRQGLNGKVLGSTHRLSYRSKFGVLRWKRHW